MSTIIATLYYFAAISYISPVRSYVIFKSVTAKANFCTKTSPKRDGQRKSNDTKHRNYFKQRNYSNLIIMNHENVS